MRPKKGQLTEKANYLRNLRETALFEGKKLTQEILAREIGVAVSTIRRWENGLAEPTMTIKQMKDFCRTLRVNFYELPDSLIQIAF